MVEGWSLAKRLRGEREGLLGLSMQVAGKVLCDQE